MRHDSCKPTPGVARPVVCEYCKYITEDNAKRSWQADAGRREAYRLTPNVCEYWKYMPQDNMRNDGCKPTPGVATPKKVSKYSKYEPQDMGHNAGKLTPGVATPLVPRRSQKSEWSEYVPCMLDVLPISSSVILLQQFLLPDSQIKRSIGCSLRWTSARILVTHLELIFLWFSSVWPGKCWCGHYRLLVHMS
jgi:hypothetical protein